MANTKLSDLLLNEPELVSKLIENMKTEAFSVTKLFGKGEPLPKDFVLDAKNADLVDDIEYHLEESVWMKKVHVDKSYLKASWATTTTRKDPATLTATEVALSDAADVADPWKPDYNWWEQRILAAEYMSLGARDYQKTYMQQLYGSFDAAFPDGSGKEFKTAPDGRSNWKYRFSTIPVRRSAHYNLMKQAQSHQQLWRDENPECTIPEEKRTQIREEMSTVREICALLLKG